MLVLFSFERFNICLVMMMKIMNHSSLTILLNLHRYPTKPCIFIINILIIIFVNRTHNKDGEKHLFWLLT